jgi:hypothetical protein
MIDMFILVWLPIRHHTRGLSMEWGFKSGVSSQQLAIDCQQLTISRLALVIKPQWGAPRTLKIKIHPFHSVC